MSSGTVVLRDYPVQLGMSVAEHVEDWMREFALMRLGGESTASREVPERLRTMVQHLRTSYASQLSEPDRVRAAAAARGDLVVDLTYEVVPETEEAVLGWQQMLAQVDEFCRSEDLLTLQRTPEQVALNDWVCEEFLRQVRGGSPRPWRPAGTPATQA